MQADLYTHLVSIGTRTISALRLYLSATSKKWLEDIQDLLKSGIEFDILKKVVITTRYCKAVTRTYCQ